MGSRGGASRFSVGVIDMTGQEVAGCRVIERGANVFGSATWRVLAACGHSITVLGTRLRQAAKTDAIVRCAQCRPKRPGTVQRKQVERSWDPRPLWVRALEARGQEVRFNV